MARGHYEDSSTDITASSSEDEGLTRKKRRRSKKTTINIGGQANHVAVGVDAKVMTAAAETADMTDNAFDAAEKLKNPTAFLEAVAKCRGTEKDKIERDILQYLLPYIEDHATKAASSCNDALELLTKFCSPDLKSPRLIIYSLKTMKRLLLLDFGNCESANAHIIEVERILRRPFVDGSFAEELQHIQRRRVEVYNSVLALIILYLAKGHLKPPYINKKEKEEIRHSVTKNIEKSLQRNPCPTKDRWRFSMETVLKLIERLFDYKKLSQMTKLLDLWKDNTMEAFLEKLQCTESGSVDRFVILKMLHGKSCSNDGKSYRIVERIIKNHDVFSKQGQHHRNEDWQFVLLACQTLLHTINSSKINKATRTQAAHCLASLLSAKVYRKSAVIRNIIEKHCIKTSFARDLESRKIVIERRFQPELLDQVLIEREVFIKQICKVHESKGLEYIEIIYEDEDRLIVRGLYDYQPVAITVAIINPMKKLYSAQDQDLSSSERRLQNETAVLQHLNQTSNEHVLMVHSADTKTRPFHMICEYMPKEDLLHFLKICKKEQEPPSYRQLLEICLKISNCMIFILGKHVIHNQLRPEHVLLDENFNVRITGFFGAEIISESQMKSGIQGEKLGFEDPSLRFAAPECLEDVPLLSPESDVWAFGVLMYVVFTCGGTPYANEDIKEIHQHVLSGRTLTKDFLRDEIFSLIQKCMGKTRKDRISFTKISEDLKKLLSDCDGKGADERLRILEPVPKENGDTQDEDLAELVSLPMEEENTSNTSQLTANPVISNAKAGFEPLHKKMKRQRTFPSRKEFLVDYSKGHLETLRSLDHPHLARIVKDKRTKSGRVITYENCDGPSLRNYILSNDCTPNDVIRFAAQITEAINYLHSKNIVLCVLNAESVRVVNNHHVKIFGLHFSRSVFPSGNEFNTSFGVVQGEVDPDMCRWFAKEVIQEGLFSPAGDVWSLGMTILEMFLCLSKDADSAIPFSQYSDEEILNALKMNCRPVQPAQCPDWVYVLVTQCWCLHTSERASSLSVLDCLTNKCPWESYVLQRWIEKHEIHENWPSLNVAQQLDAASCISRQDVERSVTDEFVDYHSYEYERPFWLKKIFSNVVIAGKRFLMPSSRPSGSGSRPPHPHILSTASSVSSSQSSSNLASSVRPSSICTLSYKCDDTYDCPILPVNEVTCRPRSRSVSLPPLPLPSNSPRETPTNIKQKEEKGKDDNIYDDIDDRPILPVNEVTCPRSRSVSLPPLPLPSNSPRETPTNIKQKKEKGKDDNIYDDIDDRPILPVNEVTCPRSRSVSLPPLPLPSNSPSETPTNIKQKEEKGKGDNGYDDNYDSPILPANEVTYDDIYDRPILSANEVTCHPRSRSVSFPTLPLPSNSPRETPTDIKQKEEKGKDNDDYDDNCDRQKPGDIHDDPDQDCNTPNSEPEMNMSGESYQELSYSTEDGYTPLVRDSREMINGHDNGVPNTSTYLNMPGSGTASANNEDTIHTTYYQPVFFMNL